MHFARRTRQGRTKWSITSVVRFSNLVRTFPRLVLVAVLTVGVGLHSLAVKHYERVLEIAEKKAKTDPDVGSSPNEEQTIILTLHRTLG